MGPSVNLGSLAEIDSGLFGAHVKMHPSGSFLDGDKMQKLLLHEIYGNLFSTLIALMVIAFTYTVLDFMVARKIESHRQKRRFRIRSLYVACFIFIFFMARIWVEGFTHLIAILGLVSAALVVTNKETIMNFVGWLIINWRGLFAEDDLIQIQQYKGYVKSFGVLYFSMFEVSDRRNGSITGRVIRIPNGLVANNALINFSQTSRILEQTFTIIITTDSNLEYSIQFLSDLVNEVVTEFYKGKKKFSKEYLVKNHKPLAALINLEAKVYISPKLTQPTGVELVTHYYCFSQDCEQIQQKIWLRLLTRIDAEPLINLAYATK